MYKVTLGDILLKIFKMVFSAEFRHRCLPWLAWAYRFSFKKNSVVKPFVVNFWDGSGSWNLQSPIFLAAGASKNGKNVMSFSNMGFAGVTVGSVTSTPHIGNPHRPRVALIPKDESIQNAMGLGNDGLSQVMTRLKNQRLNNQKSNQKQTGQNLKIGLSLTEKPGSKIGDEVKFQILEMFQKAYDFVDYFEINLSCPNTGSGRIDQYLDFAEDLIKAVAEERKLKQEKKAVFIKLSPDMKESSFKQFLTWIETYGLTGVVLANTLPLTDAISVSSLSVMMKTPFEKTKVLNHQGGRGGLSGQILYQNTLTLVKKAKKLNPKLSIIAVGGVDSGQKVQELLNAGADVVQCYSVLAYQWNAVGRMLKYLNTESNYK